ncbi:DUF3800 domain-containing protein [Patescibacteria group bacterium]
MAIKSPHTIREFDFFLDEDVRAQRIGILCLEKELTPALCQALFRVKEDAQSYHVKRIEGKTTLTSAEKKEKINSIKKQLREPKWSNLNLMRSFIAQGFIQHFFHYWGKGPLPIMFFNAPFNTNHLTSINDFYNNLQDLKLDALKYLNYSQSILFTDSFNTPAGYKFEEIVRNTNNLSRCYRVDSRAHDLIQLADLLLGVTTYINTKKRTKSKAKLNLVKAYKGFIKTTKTKHSGSYQSVYTI